MLGLQYVLSLLIEEKNILFRVIRHFELVFFLNSSGGGQ